MRRGILFVLLLQPTWAFPATVQMSTAFPLYAAHIDGLVSNGITYDVDFVNVWTQDPAFTPDGWTYKDDVLGLSGATLFLNDLDGARAIATAMVSALNEAGARGVAGDDGGPMFFPNLLRTVTEIDGDLIWSPTAFYNEGTWVHYSNQLSGWTLDTDGYTYSIPVFTVSAVPVPAAVWLFGSALAGLSWLRRRQSVVVSP